MTNPVLIGLLARFIQTKQPDNSTTMSSLKQFAAALNSWQMSSPSTTSLKDVMSIGILVKIQLPASHKRIAAAANPDIVINES